jgi:hypothetical protein
MRTETICCADSGLSFFYLLYLLKQLSATASSQQLSAGDANLIRPCSKLASGQPPTGKRQQTKGRMPLTSCLTPHLSLKTTIEDRPRAGWAQVFPPF